MSTLKSAVNVDDEVMSETPTEEGGESPRTRSNVWKNFTRIGKDEEGYERATCNNCSHAYRIGKNPVSGQNYGTSHLTRHICKGNEVTSGKKIDLNTHRTMLAEAIIKHDLPFSFVEYDKIRQWIHYLNPDAEMISRNTAVSDVEKVYSTEKNKLKELLSRISNRVCLTSDCWTAVTGEGYICLTAHFADENWKLCSKILNFCRVKPPHSGIELEATLFECLVSGSHYSTSSLYFMEVWKIQCLLEQNQSSDDVVIKEMSMMMKTKFDQYWENYSVVLAFGAILDPRLKVFFLTYCYQSLDPSTYLEKVKHVTDKFDKLYEEYATNYTNSTTSLSQSFIDSSSSAISSGERPKPKRAKIGFNQYLSKTSSSIGKNEIEVYLNEEKIALDEEHPEEYDVFQYWKVNEKKYPILSLMARDILCIPITTVASESAFSIGGRVLTKYRSSTLPEHIQMLICTRNWLHGYVENPSDEDICAEEEFEFDVHDVDLH